MGKTKIARALTIAGSDSGGGAGIQADLKTFAALGVHGMSAITCITAQNTATVTAIVPIDPEFVIEQVRACIDDIGTDAIKTGMLFSREIIEAVHDELIRLNVPIVVDPVMVAKSGAKLLEDEAIEAMRKLISKATVVTPNAYEAYILTGVEVRNEQDQMEAAKSIAKFGAKAVVVKGGHLNGSESADVLFYEGRYLKLTSQRIHTKNTHGTGCVFASAIAAELAKGSALVEAVKAAKDFVTEAIRNALEIGRGNGPVNPSWSVYRDAEAYRATVRLQRAVERLESIEGAGELAPESMINIGEALPYARGREDVIAIPGRIVRLGGRLKASSPPRAGASRHVANALLTIASYNPSVRAAMNVRFDEFVLKAAESAGYTISHYDRSNEPEEVKKAEGATIRWGISEAIRSAGKVTDVIYHRGDVGKEPMMLITGRDSLEVVEKFKRILDEYLRIRG